MTDKNKELREFLVKELSKRFDSETWNSKHIEDVLQYTEYCITKREEEVFRAVLDSVEELMPEGMSKHNSYNDGKRDFAINCRDIFKSLAKERGINIL